MMHRTIHVWYVMFGSLPGTFLSGDPSFYYDEDQLLHRSSRARSRLRAWKRWTRKSPSSKRFVDLFLMGSLYRSLDYP